jgi:hypothetical protein
MVFIIALLIHRAAKQHGNQHNSQQTKRLDTSFQTETPLSIIIIQKMQLSAQDCF